MATLVLTSQGLEDLPTLASALLQFAHPERVFAFQGDLGAGKTTFIKRICEQLGVAEPVTSPTFSLVHEYAGTEDRIYHFDLYRIKHEVEVEEIGWFDYLDGESYLFIEWPERIAGLLPDERVDVKITQEADGSRTFYLSK